MPVKDDETRSDTEDMLQTIIAASKNFKGKTYLIPGDNDWNNHRDGWSKGN